LRCKNDRQLTSYSSFLPLFLASVGVQKDEVFKDAYNFYLSQVHIRIEMAFGLLCNKWRILQRPLQVNIKNAGKVFLCCARLQNFVINNERLQVLERSVVGDDDQGGDNDNELSFLPSDTTIAPIAGNSIMRDVLVQRITNLCLVRPEYNLQRNANNPY
jgi:DDE superfamily endonuclease